MIRWPVSGSTHSRGSSLVCELMNREQSRVSINALRKCFINSRGSGRTDIYFNQIRIRLNDLASPKHGEAKSLFIHHIRTSEDQPNTELDVTTVTSGGGRQRSKVTVVVLSQAVKLESRKRRDVVGERVCGAESLRQLDMEKGIRHSATGLARPWRKP